MGAWIVRFLNAITLFVSFPVAVIAAIVKDPVIVTVLLLVLFVKPIIDIRGEMDAPMVGLSV